MHKLFSRLAAVALMSAAISPAFAQKICIDPGHGGSDPGAVGNGQQEKANVLDSCIRFRNWLNTDTADSRGGGSWSTVMTRTTDVYVSLQGRCDISNNNGASRFACTHNNAFNQSAHGTETFCVAGASATTADFRNKIHDRTIQVWGLTNRGVKTASFYVLVNTAAPAELAELGFIDAAPDYQYVGNATHRDNCARYHLYAIQNHFGITAYTPSTTSNAQTYVNDSPSASGWSTGTSAADKYGASYLFRSTAAVSNPASWTSSVAAGGSYSISAWWPAGTNRSTVAPFVMPGGGTITANQQINGGKWNVLTNKSLAAGANTTQLSCWAPSGFVVVADAIRYIGPN
jgi:N-acetylmuramoyl-L-alanine amidase